MLKLFQNNEEDEEINIKTNNEYATAYNKWRQKEELNKLKTKYGDHINLDESDGANDTSSSEDEEDEELPQEFEKDFFKTLSCLKNRDPRIYDEKTVFFKESTEEVKKEKTKKQEPMFMKDYERKMILEKGAKFEDSDEESVAEDPRSDSPTYVEEQRRIRESFQKVLSGDEEEEQNWGGLFQKRSKTKEEVKKEEEDYRKWLKGQQNEIEDKSVEVALKPLKEFWNDPKLEKNEAFLRDYLLNKRYLEKEDESHIPTYEEIIHDSDAGLSEDEEAIEKQEEFETKYNFRFEEPDDEFIKRYPRTMEVSLRRKDDKRKVKREELKKRKEEEKKQKQEDLKQMKILKRKEIEEKIKKLKEITGNHDMIFQEGDLEDDFDPDAYDQRMQELFNDNYYEGNEGEQKPEYPDLDEELGPWKGNQIEPHCEDDNFIMDCDYDPKTAKNDKESKKKKRNRPGKDGKMKEEFDELDENDERYKEYMDELYELDYEDKIGDIPCRFRYREVVPNDFGLTVEEILLAKDKELNRWCSLKKAFQHRPEHMEKYDVIAYQKKANNLNLKQQILPSIFTEFEDGTNNLNSNNHSSEVRGNDINTYNVSVEENGFDDKLEENIAEVEQKENQKKSKNKKIKHENVPNTFVNSFEAKEDAQNMSGKKQKKKLPNKSIEDNTEKSSQPTENVNNAAQETATNKKKNKRIRLNSAIESQSIENKELNNTTEESALNSNKKGQKRKHDEINEPSKENTKNVSPSKKRKKKKKKKPTQQTNDSPNKNVSNTENKPNSGNEENQKLSRRQKKNKNKTIKNASKTSETDANKNDKQSRKRKHSEQGNNTKTKKVKLNKKNANVAAIKDGVKISDARLAAYGINPKKFKNKLKYKK